MLRKIRRCTLLAVVGLVLGCGGSGTADLDNPVAATANDSTTEPPASSATDDAVRRVVMQTSAGDITLDLDAESAPLTVENFLFYANQGHYDNTIFHRVIAGFVVQGGGFTADYTQKPTVDPVANEADNGLKNVRYSIAMARTADPQSATSQFYINLGNNSFLDYTAPTAKGWGYAVFGQVVDGFEVVNSIASAATGAGGPFAQDVPLEQIVIQSVRIQ